jgi:hypothetical protein
MTKSPVRPLFSGLLGITLLLPATYFMATLLLRICFGTTTLYYSIAPSFLQSPFGIFAFHKAQFIFYGAFLALVFNLLTIFRFRLQREEAKWMVTVTYRRHWLNTAIALQSGLLFLALLIYTLIQHVRY